MAAVIFDATTLATDQGGSPTYRLAGRVLTIARPALASLDIIPVPRTAAKVAKVMSIDPGQYAIAFSVLMEDGLFDDWLALVSGKAGIAGTLSIPRLTLTNCVITDTAQAEEGYELVSGSSGRFRYRVTMQFEKLL